MPDTDRQEQGRPETHGKKAYTTPTLTEYGSVAKLTMGKGTTSIEGSPNRKTP